MRRIIRRAENAERIEARRIDKVISDAWDRHVEDQMTGMSAEQKLRFNALHRHDPVRIENGHARVAAVKEIYDHPDGIFPAMMGGNH